MSRLISVLLVTSLFISLLLSSISAEYIEGTDTTNANGYCRDSSFSISEKGAISGTNIVKYFQHSDYGYFNYTFEEIKTVPENPGNVKIVGQFPVQFCFSVKKKNGTYMKVQIQKKLDNGRYVYKYGNNTVPGDRLLEKQDYDRSILYKPNNLYFSHQYHGSITTLTWDPPLENDNHLTGYILYASKGNVSIDTTAPINLNQWDSVTIADTVNKLVGAPIGQECYYNLVAVYTEGKSDFLQGWTCDRYPAVNVKQGKSWGANYQSTITFQVSPAGGFFTCTSPLKQFMPLSLALYDAGGRYITSFSAKNGEPVYLNPQDHNVAGGMYIVKAMAGKEVLAKQAFTIAR